MAPKKAQKKGWRAGVGGGIAAAISRTIVSPLERLRMQMITDGTRYPSNMACLRDVWAKEGVKGFWAGNGAFKIRDVHCCHAGRLLLTRFARSGASLKGSGCCCTAGGGASTLTNALTRSAAQQQQQQLVCTRAHTHTHTPPLYACATARQHRPSLSRSRTHTSRHHRTCITALSHTRRTTFFCKRCEYGAHYSAKRGGILLQGLLQEADRWGQAHRFAAHGRVLPLRMHLHYGNLSA
jgi:hypothetical protein